MKEKIKWFIILHAIIMIYSISGICSKTAASYEFLSFRWIVFYGLVVAILGFYAIAWQQVLKHLQLITSYANKSATTIWGIIWGIIVFGEQLSLQRVIGAAVVILGVYLVVTGDENDNKDFEEEVKNNV